MLIDQFDVDPHYSELWNRLVQCSIVHLAFIEAISRSVIILSLLQVTEYSTILGQIWYLCVFLFRGMVVVTIGGEGNLNISRIIENFRTRITNILIQFTATSSLSFSAAPRK